MTGNDKSASGYQFPRLFLTTAHPLQADVIIDRMVKTLLATSPELKRGRAGTESDRVHLPLDDTIAHRSFSNRRCHRWQPTTFRVCFHDRPM